MQGPYEARIRAVVLRFIREMRRKFLDSMGVEKASRSDVRRGLVVLD